MTTFTQSDALRDRWWRGLTPNQKAVVGVLLFHNDFETDTSFPSAETIARECGLSRATVVRTLRGLAMLDLVVTVGRGRAARRRLQFATGSNAGATGSNPISNRLKSDLEQAQHHEPLTMCEPSMRTNNQRLVGSFARELQGRGVNISSKLAKEAATVYTSLTELRDALDECPDDPAGLVVVLRRMIAEEREPPPTTPRGLIVNKY